MREPESLTAPAAAVVRTTLYQNRDVRFAPKRRHRLSALGCPLSAKYRESRRNQISGIDSSAFELIALLDCLAPLSEVRIARLARRHDLRVDSRQSLGGLLSLRPVSA
jgi:hypothetical protein